MLLWKSNSFLSIYFTYSPEPGLGFYSVYERKYISYDWSQDGAINLSYWSFFGPGATKIPPAGEPRYINIQILLDFLYTRSNQFKQFIPGLILQLGIIGRNGKRRQWDKKGCWMRRRGRERNGRGGYREG